MRTGTRGTAAAAVFFQLAAAGSACAYEAGDLLVQLMAEGFYTGASGRLAPGVNFDSGRMTANPALDLTYFFTKNLAVHTVIAAPLAKVDLRVGSRSVNATDQWALPMSIVGQYHFFSDAQVSPYIGAGLTYAKFWEDESHLGQHVEVGDTYGGLVNFGINVKIPESRWVVAVDAKKLWLAPANVHLGGARMNNVSVNPWWFGIGIGYTFATPPLF